MKTVGVGVLGLGNFTQHQHLPNLSRMPEARIHAVCDINPDITKRIQLKYGAEKGYTDYRKFLADPGFELAVIAVPDNLQVSFAVSALGEGKHVYVEKPLAETKEGFDEVQDSVQKSKLRLSVGFNRRFAPIYRKMREITWADGGPRNMYLRMVDDAWRWGAGYRPGFLLKHDACHLFDLVRWFTQSEIVSVFSNRSRPDDNAVLLQMADKTIATIILSGHGTIDMPKEQVDIITTRGGLSAFDFVELRTYGFPSFEHAYTFPGHSHPDGEFMHKYLMEKLGLFGWDAIRRMIWELRQELEAAGTSSIALSSTDAEEIDRFITSTIPNFLRDAGWMASLQSFLKSIAEGNMESTDHTGVEDARKAFDVSEAAIRSQESGKVVRL